MVPTVLIIDVVENSTNMTLETYNVVSISMYMYTIIKLIVLVVHVIYSY